MGPDHAEMLSSLPALPNAECRDHYEPDIFFPEDYRDMAERAQVAAQALAACSICPEVDACFRFGMEKENVSYGIYGGTLSGERMALARRRGRVAALAIQEAKRLRRRIKIMEDDRDVA